MATNSPVADRRRSRDARRQQLPKRFICNVACTVPPPFVVGVALLWTLWCGVMRPSRCRSLRRGDAHEGPPDSVPADQGRSVPLRFWAGERNGRSRVESALIRVRKTHDMTPRRAICLITDRRRPATRHRHHGPLLALPCRCATIRKEDPQHLLRSQTRLKHCVGRRRRHIGTWREAASRSFTERQKEHQERRILTCDRSRVGKQ